MNTSDRIKTVFPLILLIVIMAGCSQPQNDDVNIRIESKVDSLIALMTLEEKIGMIHASSSFTSGGVERLGIPELIMSDGPHGVRHEHGRDWEKDKNVYDSSTYLPVGTALASTWNRDLGYEYGKVLGSEANFRGKDIILGPGINIIRSPLNGRNFEYLSEDPYHNGQMAIGYIKGVQEQDVAVSVKHYVANTLEYDREYVNVEMSDRALREIYLPGYKAAVQDGGAHTVMAAYNKFRGTYCAHSNYLLDDILKDEFGFEGLVVSDWAAVKSTIESVNAGLDIEMGTDLTMFSTGLDYSKFYMGDTLITLVQSGEVAEAKIDAKVRRILRVMYKINKFGEKKKGVYNTLEHQQVSKSIADEAMVLLKNESFLPLNRENIKTLAVIGANANHRHAGAGGSSQVKAFYEITPMQGLKNLLGDDVNIVFSPGYKIERGAVADPALISEAVNVARTADAVIYVGGHIHGYSDDWNDNAYDAEVLDKPDMFMPFGQEELIKKVLEANDNTTIVLVSGGAIDMTGWLENAKAVIYSWYAGMEGGNTLAEIIFGQLNPSGKLPFSFPRTLEDSPAHSIAEYPDTNLLIDHKDDIYVGYRYFDTYQVEPAFAFGHGLSYTEFEFSNLSVEKSGNKVNISVDIKNIGKRSGKEVVQVYIKDVESSKPRPEKEIKEFAKVTLAPEEIQSVKFTLEESSFMYYDDDQGKWLLEPGTFEILVGNSSRNIMLKDIIDF